MSIFPADRRRELPDEPGVYLFRDQRGKVIYVGKAKSIRKRVASHFSNPSTRAGREILEMIDQIEALVVQTEAEALLVEQNFIKQYKPRFNIRLRDDKSYPYIAISLDEEFPRVYFTRERHRRDRAYFGPYSNAKRVRATLEVLGKVFMFRSCEGPEPGRRSGSPCLDYYIKRCEAPCVGYVDAEQYRRAIDGVIDFLSGRYKEIERELESRDEQAPPTSSGSRTPRASATGCGRSARCSSASGSPTRAPGRSTRSPSRSIATPARPTRRSSRSATACSRTARASTSTTPPTPRIAEVAEAFILQYYASAMSVPPLLVVQREVGQNHALAEALSARRGGPVEIRAAERGDKRRILELAERNARLAIDQEKLRSERRRQQRVEALDGLAAGARPRHDPAADRVLRHLDADGHQHGRVDGRVRGRGAEEVRLPALQGVHGRRRRRRRRQRRPRRLRRDGGDPRPADGPLGAAARRLAARQGLRPELRGAAEPGRDRRRQGSAVGRAARARRGSASAAWS